MAHTVSTSKSPQILRVIQRGLLLVSFTFFTALLARADSRLVNLSSHALVSPSQTLSAGLSIGGSASETVLIRAIGPALSQYGISNPLSDPSLTIYNSAKQVISGPVTNWKASDATAMSSVGAFALPSGSADAAVVMNLAPGTYTATVNTAGGHTGVVMLEAYEVSSTGGQLVNLSSRATVSGGSNGNVVTGFVVSGSTQRTLLIRAVGPTLSEFSVPSPLSNPTLQLMDQAGNVIANNDDWGASVNSGVAAAALATAFSQANAFSLPAGSADAAILVNATPGTYSVNVASATGGSGAALAEIYDVTAVNGTISTDSVSSSNVAKNPETGTPPPPSSTPPVTTPPPVTTTPPYPTTTVPGDNMDDTDLVLPQPGNNILHVLTPNLLEVQLVNTVPQGSSAVTSLNFVNSNAQITTPGTGEFTVTINGQQVNVTNVNFKRRVLYAPLATYDLRILNSIYLTLNNPIQDGQSVQVTNPDTSLWPTTANFYAIADPARYNPAIHVNQEGYVPSFPKKAMIGYYLGDGGELKVTASTFNIIDAGTGASVFSGNLTARAGDVGFNTSPAPYQKVMVADFSSFTTPGQYQLQVPGMGASLPFLIDDGIAMAWTRTYALGLYEQRSGMATTLPYTRFTHAADHTAPAQVPSPDSDPQFSFTWKTVAGYSSTLNPNNPTQIAPTLVSEATSLYPFVNKGTIDVSGGHFDAGDYSKYTENSAQLVHELMFSVDSIAGVAQMDNLGIAESGDGIPDALQEAKWEADFLSKMQDADGGFYFLCYPKTREYEGNVLPEDGDAQVVWPKNTSVSAASTAALAEAASSPAMKKYYPAAAAAYMAKAKLGWQFLQNAIAKYGKAGAYQKITFYSDNWTHDDELAWAASAMYAATGDTQYQTQLFQWFPDPTDSTTFRWGWWRMSEGWGNAIRTYAFAARSGRLNASQLDAGYLAKCNTEIVAAGDDVVHWCSESAYGTPFPDETKAVNSAGWYFSLDQASDIAVAYQINPKPEYLDALVQALNYEGGTNPVNVVYLTGLGMKRQRENVSQYAQNDRRILPPSGIPLGNIQSNFQWIGQYGATLNAVSYPSDNAGSGPYPFYDRWSDAYNVTTEYIGVNQARSFMASAMLANLTSRATPAWVAPKATISLPTTTVGLNTPTNLTVSVPGMDLTGARVVWEGRDQQPTFGSTFAFVPVNNGDQWVEVEVEWSDGRRAFAAGDFQANSPVQTWMDDAAPAGAQTTGSGGDSWNWVSSNPGPHSGNLALQTSAASGEHDLTFTYASGTMQVAAGDNLFAWIYLDPSNPPSEIMMCWNDGSSWEHRAYWGANQIGWGTNGTPGCFNVGGLPATGGWVKISVPASAVNLQGATVNGLTLALYGGKATWDTIGRASAGN